MPWLKIIREKVQDDLKKRIIRKAPKEYVDKLMPDYLTLFSFAFLSKY